ncbi:Uncharacterized protein Rs2_39116 [Raphanus sativus]|nr:Uncharacterized protein Rs2_39116 [Raphanus sativus]
MRVSATAFANAVQSVACSLDLSFTLINATRSTQSLKVFLVSCLFRCWGFPRKDGVDGYLIPGDGLLPWGRRENDGTSNRATSGHYLLDEDFDVKSTVPTRQLSTASE